MFFHIWRILQEFDRSREKRDRGVGQGGRDVPHLLAFLFFPSDLYVQGSF